MTCQCEHLAHETGDGHRYLGVPAGKRLGMYVGPICDECAMGHMCAYVVCSKCWGDLGKATGVCTECGHDEWGYYDEGPQVLALISQSTDSGAGS